MAHDEPEDDRRAAPEPPRQDRLRDRSVTPPSAFDIASANMAARAAAEDQKNLEYLLAWAERKRRHAEWCAETWKFLSSAIPAGIIVGAGLAVLAWLMHFWPFSVIGHQ